MIEDNSLQTEYNCMECRFLRITRKNDIFNKYELKCVLCKEVLADDVVAEPTRMIYQHCQLRKSTAI